MSFHCPYITFSFTSPLILSASDIYYIKEQESFFNFALLTKNLIIMKSKFILTSMVLLFAATYVFSQISNNGFELWNNMGTYMDPQSYKTTNSFMTGTFYPVTRSTDHYPSNVGSYSIRLENKTTVQAAVGLAMQTSNLQNGPEPSFQLTGHPTSFTGYYKYLPLGNDTMFIQLTLYQGGTAVAWALLTGTASVSNWTSFNVPISSYTTADSASILLASFYANGSNQPHGNSVLYVDNLNFDNLITSINEADDNGIYKTVFYPNPATNHICLNSNPEIKTFELYDINGKLVKNILISTDYTSIAINDLMNGIYLCRTLDKNGNVVKKEKLIIE